MKALLFDVDDTLYNQIQPFERAYWLHLPEFREIDIEKLFALSRRYSDEVFEASQNGRISMEEMYIYRIQKALQDFQIYISDDRALDFQASYQDFQKKIELSEEMKRLLEDCKGKAQLGIITNGPEGHQWDKIQALGVTSWIPEECIFVSGTLNIAKPDRRIFEYAAEKMELNVAECYYIGDSIENDVTGASNAGWKSVWINRRNKRNDREAVPDYMVYTEQELHDLLIRLCKE